MKRHLCSHKSKLAGIFLTLSIFLSGCSSSYSVSSTGKPGAEYSHQEMNEELRGRHVTIELNNRKEVAAEDVMISNDTISWVDVRMAERSLSATRYVKRVVFKNHWIGLLEGLGIGLVGGGGLGALVGRDLSTPEGNFKTYGAVIGFIVGGGAGLLGGAIAGAAIGHSRSFEFSSPEQSDSLQSEK